MDIEATATGLTYDDVQRMYPEVDMVRRELVGGKLYVTASPIPRHQRVVVRLMTRLHHHATRHGGEVLPGPIDVFFGPRDVVEPDIVFVGPDRLDQVEERFVRGAPDLVVEVSSPSTRRHDLVRKRRLYEEHGVPEFWFVDLDHDRIDEYRLGDRRYSDPVTFERGEALTSAAIEGFSAPVDEILGI